MLCFSILRVIAETAFLEIIVKSIFCAAVIWFIILLLYIQFYNVEYLRVIIFDINIVYGSCCGGFFVRKCFN
jgi:hypothetical protein